MELRLLQKQQAVRQKVALQMRRAVLLRATDQNNLFVRMRKPSPAQGHASHGPVRGYSLNLLVLFPYCYVCGCNRHMI